jgi:hypothetical protein
VALVQLLQSPVKVGEAQFSPSFKLTRLPTTVRRTFDHPELKLSTTSHSLKPQQSNMASRILPSATRFAQSGRRSFQTTARRLQEPVITPLPVRKPVGAFRGGSVQSLPYIPNITHESELLADTKVQALWFPSGQHTYGRGRLLLRP